MSPLFSVEHYCACAEGVCFRSEISACPRGVLAYSLRHIVVHAEYLTDGAGSERRGGAAFFRVHYRRNLLELSGSFGTPHSASHTCGNSLIVERKRSRGKVVKPVGSGSGSACVERNVLVKLQSFDVYLLRKCGCGRFDEHTHNGVKITRCFYRAELHVNRRKVVELYVNRVVLHGFGDDSGAFVKFHSHEHCGAADGNRVSLLCRCAADCFLVHKIREYKVVDKSGERLSCYLLYRYVKFCHFLLSFR